MLKRVTALVPVLLFSGCAAIGPDFKQPHADLTERWSEAVSERATQDKSQRYDWWNYFNDPVLTNLIESAYQQNLTLQIAGLRVHESRALLGYATGTLYPQRQGISGSSSTIKISENSDPIATFPGAVGDLIDTGYNRHAVGLDAAWELDFWGRFRRGVESADANLAASLATYDDVLISVTGEVAATYALLRSLEERLGYAQKNTRLQQRSMEIAEVRFDNGLVTELDVQLARALLGNTRAIIPTLKTGIKQTKLALSLLLGLPPSDLNDILQGDGVIPTTSASIALGVPADLLRRRPDIRRSELMAAAQSARIGLAEADMYPAFRLAGTIGYSAASGGDVFNSGSDFGVGVFGFDWKILSYGRIKNRVRQEDAKLQQALTHYQNTVLNAAREVESGLSGFLRATERVEALTDSVEASRRAVELAQTQYRDGAISYTLVLDAQQFLLLNEDQLTAARGDVATSMIATYKALGGGWQIRHGNSLISDSNKDEMQERSNWGDLLEDGSVEPVPESERGSWRAPDM